MLMPLQLRMMSPAPPLARNAIQADNFRVTSFMSLTQYSTPSGTMLNYRQLIRHPKFKEAWTKSSAKKFGRLFQGIGGRTTKPTNTCFFINRHQVPAERFKDVTYCKFVCSVQEQKKETNCTRGVLGGNCIHFPGNVRTSTADMLFFKILLNSVVSTTGANFMAFNVSNFYLNTPMRCYEYVKMRLANIPDKVVKVYKLHENEKVTNDGFIYVKV